MITSKLFLKNDQMRVQFKIIIVLVFLLSGLMLWDCNEIQKDIKSAKATIYRHDQLEDQLELLKKTTTDSIIQDALLRSKKGVFEDWIEIAYWVERNRHSAYRFGAEYSYNIDSLVTHPQSHDRTKEVNIRYRYSHISQNFEDLIKLLHITQKDTSKSLFIKQVEIHADSLGIKNSSTLLGGWIQE